MGEFQLLKLSNEQYPERVFNMERMEDIYENHVGRAKSPHRHDFYTLIWVKEGSGSHLIDFREYAIQPNQIYFLSPGQVHMIHTPERPTGCVISFTSEFLIRNDISLQFISNINLFKPYNESPPLLLDTKTGITIDHIIEEMYLFFKGGKSFRFEALGALTKLFLIHCNNVCNLSREESTEEVSKLLLGFKQLVEDNFKSMHKVKDYAELLFVTPKHLNEITKGALGYTAKDYIIDRVGLEAKRLLLHSKLSIKGVASQVGFKDQLHFSSFFKKYSNESPTEFRDRNAMTIG